MIKTVYTKNAPDAIGPYSQATTVGNFIFTSGQIPINPESGNVEAAGIESQTEQVIKNLSAVLKESGSSLEKVIKTTCFISDMNNFTAFNQVYSKYFTKKPARSCVEVSRLPKDVLVEIEVIAEVNE